MDTTATALVAHWNWAANKGLMNLNTANGLKSACAQVLKTFGDSWEDTDISNLDVEDLLTRFQTLRKKDFKPKVISTYKQRFRQALASYKSYLTDPSGWKPTAERVAHRERSAAPARNAGSRPGVESPVQPLPATGLVEYPFPLRDGQTVRLVLPRDLKAVEVKRLAAFMNTLAADYDVTVAE